MPSYTIDIIGVTGTSWGNFTSLGVVGTITYSDEDTFGIGDNNPDTETGALPVITGVTGSLPAGWVGQTLAFGWQQQIDGTGGPDALGMVIGGGSNFISTHLVQYPGGTPIVPGQSYTASGIQNVPNEILVCFVKGTLIETETGHIPVEKLEVGDRILTRDCGYQPLGWIGHRTITARPNQFPIEFAKGAIGNSTALRVSPQHRILLTGWRAELLFGETEILVPAKALVNDHDIRPIGVLGVTYYHIMFDRHQLVKSNGAWTESLLYSQESVNGLSSAQREEIEELFPELAATDFESCAPGLRVREGQIYKQV